MSSGLPVDRERHLRAVSYVLVALVLALIGHYVLEFDRTQTIGYAVAVYVFLNALNFRTMFGRQQSKEDERPPRRNSTPR